MFLVEFEVNDDIDDFIELLDVNEQIERLDDINVVKYFNSYI